MQRLMLLILLILFPLIASAGKIDDALVRAGLTEKQPPVGDITKERFVKYDFYRVELKDNKLFIGPIDRSEVHTLATSELQFDGFKLVGTDKGEWGGDLTLYSPKGKTQVLLKGNINKILRFRNSIYVITGLAHMGENRGNVLKLLNLETNPKIERITLLPAAPVAAITDENNIYILTIDGLLSLEYQDDDFRLRIIANNAPWSWQLPNSLVKIDNAFIVGMHSGVIVVRDEGGGKFSFRFYGK
ncbi:MAG: hypothetical protein HKP58_06195 [Desulfatitalea sp.]|nr:hypothetical protein [Desulfatitalea sp.]NNJ99987.1 hypothetical protein [Desulfatitalea sp.]